VLIRDIVGGIECQARAIFDVTVGVALVEMNVSTETNDFEVRGRPVHFNRSFSGVRIRGWGNEVRSWMRPALGGRAGMG
jgi:hypothetical protein